MKVLSDQEQEKVGDALRLSAICLQEHAEADIPIREVRAALELISRDRPADNRVLELETALNAVLAALVDPDGALLRPEQEVVDMMRRVLGVD
jgi:hypothetical protein